MYSNYGEPWSNDRNIELTALFTLGISLIDISKKQKRTLNAICGQLVRLKLVTEVEGNIYYNNQLLVNYLDRSNSSKWRIRSKI